METPKQMGAEEPRERKARPQQTAAEEAAQRRQQNQQKADPSAQQMQATQFTDWASI